MRPIGRESVETAGHLLEKIRQGNGYARVRKQRFRLASSASKVLTLSLSAASTIILGLQNLNVQRIWAHLGEGWLQERRALGSSSGSQ